MAVFSMPIQNSPRREWPYKPDPTLDGPFVWEPTAEDRRWADRNHGQTLERLKERGGMSWCEMVSIVGHRKWQKADQHAAKAECASILAALKASGAQGGDV